MTPKALRAYFETLCMFADAPVAHVDKQTGVDIERVRGLFEAGCLMGIDVSTIDGYAYADVRISAHGAEVLAQWQAMIDRDTLRTRLLATLDKLIWLVTGALLTKVADWLG